VADTSHVGGWHLGFKNFTLFAGLPQSDSPILPSQHHIGGALGYISQVMRLSSPRQISIPMCVLPAFGLTMFMHGIFAQLHISRSPPPGRLNVSVGQAAKKQALLRTQSRRGSLRRSVPWRRPWCGDCSTAPVERESITAVAGICSVQKAYAEKTGARPQENFALSTVRLKP